MYQERKINDDLYWVGANDRRLSVFEGVFAIPRGVSYNSYLLFDEKTVLMDTVDRAVQGVFFENIEHLLKEKDCTLDYIIVHHIEPDHCAALPELILRFPEVKIIGNALTIKIIKQFFDFDVESRALIVKEGDTMSFGKHSFTFYMAPMVHWPEVMISYDSASQILFSADAFGSFGAINGNLFADEVDFEHEWLPDARRYYANIVGKYGVQVQAVHKKLVNLKISMICPLHGPIWRENIPWYIEKYHLWSTYTPEETAVMIAFASVYGDTANTADILAGKLAEKGIKNIAMYDVSVTDSSQIVAEAFRCSHLVFASTTYNMGIFIKMEETLLDLQKHNLQNRDIALIENGSWAPTSGSLMKKLFDELKDIRYIAPTLTLHSALKESQLAELEALATTIAESIKQSRAKSFNHE
ncbi:MAG: FprA family A-type flavoprotein [Spirochaetaceae bacterium]|jgi:flavorubredoxin|nr:FprA family A-type flavoprotein [Spirochaetaceae bacterium]